MAFLAMLESMTQAERVALILHDVFRYPFAEVAGITGRHVSIPSVMPPAKPISGPAKTDRTWGNRAFFRCPTEGLRPRLHDDRRKVTRIRGGTMNHNSTQGVRGPLARIARRVGAIVAECNYAQARLTSLRNTPGAYRTQGN
jgi:hypothetical protein